MVRKENSRRGKSLSRWTDFMTRLGGEGGRSGGWTMGEMEKRRPKVLGRTQRRSFPGFPPVLNYRAGRLRASAQRHHTNQKTWGVSSSHQNDRGKVESGPFESEGGGGTRWKYRGRQNREEIAGQIFAWTWIAKMSTFSWRKDEFCDRISE